MSKHTGPVPATMGIDEPDRDPAGFAAVSPATYAARRSAGSESQLRMKVSDRHGVHHRMLIPYADIDDSWIDVVVRRVCPEAPGPDAARSEAG